MDNLKKTNGLVLDLLESNPDTRNSDDYLYSLVCEKIATTNGVDYDRLTHREALLQRRLLKFPSYVTVCRARRRLQVKYPHLAAKEDVEVYRSLNEDAYREEYGCGRELD